MTASWFEVADVPPTRLELHYGGRMLRCFVERPRSLHAMLASAVAVRPDATALICDERELSYAGLDELVGRVAAGLARRGVGAGDRVALLLGNSAEFVAVLFAAARLGAIAVPLGTRGSAPEHRHCLADCGAALVVHEASLADRLPADMPAATVWRDRAAPLADLLEPEPLRRAAPVAEEDTAVILYTSGTTGRPKGAMLTHLGIAHSAIHYQTLMRLSDADRLLAAVPLSHVTGLIALLAAAIHCQGALIVMPAFRAADFVALAARHRMTVSVLVPAMLNLCLLADNFAGADLSAWRLCGYGGAIMPEVTVERLSDALPGLQLMNAYGATETTSPAAAMPPDRTVARRAQVGLPVPCGQIVVLDADGVEAPPDTPGEVHIGGPMVVPGYWANPEATAREFRAGFWKSGDLGSLDADGYLRIIDRIKDVINRGGYKVYASEVENALLDHPAVAEAAVVARPCPVLGERVHAFVALRDPAVSDAALREHCALLLADYKAPETFDRLADGLPRNANGKVLKRELRLRLG